MIEHNKENCEKLADKIVDDWDMKTLRVFAYEALRDAYENDKEAFERDCESLEDLNH